MSEPLEIAEELVYQVWQKGDLEYIETVCAKDYTDYSLPESETDDLRQLRQFVADLRSAFPDLKVKIPDSFEDEMYVVLRIVYAGTHRSDYLDFAPSGERTEWESIDIFHFRENLLIERWSQNDLLEQLEGTQDDFGGMQVATEQASIIAQLADTPVQLRNAIRQNGVQEGTSDMWSTAATVGHLWRVERFVWQSRVAQLASDENPTWEYWDPGQFDWEADFGATSVNVLLDAFEFLRKLTCDYLRDLTDRQWQNQGTHLTYGVMDVAGLMQKALEHDYEHLATLTGAHV